MEFVVCFCIGIPFPSPLCMWVCLFDPKKKFYSVHSILFSLLRSIQYTLALFGPHWSYFVHFGLIRSPSVLFGPLLILFGPFCPLWFYLVHFGPIQSKLVLFDPICPLQSYLVPFTPLCPLRSYSFHLFLFSPIRSTFFLFGHILSIWSTLSHSIHLTTAIHFGPIWSIFVYLQNGKRHIWVERKTSFLYNQYNFYLLSLGKINK